MLLENKFHDLIVLVNIHWSELATSRKSIFKQKHGDGAKLE